MIICHSRQYIFIHIHKTGGTSVESALEATLCWNDLLLGSTPYGETASAHYSQRFGLHKHSALAEIYSVCSDAPELRDYRVVSVVRDPVDRLLSLHRFVMAKLQGLSHQLRMDMAALHRSQEKLASAHSVLTWPATRAALAGGGNFEAFISSPFMAEEPAFRSQVAMLSWEGQLAPNLAWVRSEDLATSAHLFTHLCGKEVAVPRLNVTPHVHGVAKPPGSTIDRVRSLFKADYETFGF